MGNEMMNRFLGIAIEMVFNRHRRREILFWWLYFFFYFFFCGFLFPFFSFLGLLYSMGTRNPGGEAQRKLQRRACWKPYSPVYLAFCSLSTENTAILQLQIFHYPRTLSHRPLLETTYNSFYCLLPRYNTFVPPWILKTQITTQTIRTQKTHTPREKNPRVVLSCVVRPGVLLSNNAKTLPSSAARNAVS